MTPAQGSTVSRVAARALPLFALVGVLSSAFMVAQYALPPALSACGEGGGCNTVRACWSGLGVLGRVSLPWLGVLLFSALLAFSLSDKRELRRALPAFGALMGLGGLGLILLQLVVCTALCKFCLTSDLAGLGCAVSALLASRADEVRFSRVTRVSAAIFAVVSVLLALAVGGPGALRNGPGPMPPNAPQVVTPLPEPIASEQRPGVVTLVEFADFECPYCRMQHLVLHRVLPTYGARVRFVRKQIPLARIHVHAEDAARAALCAEEQGRGEELADRLFRAEDLTPDGCASEAQRVGVDMTAFRACLASERPNARIEGDRARARGAGVNGLPTMFVANERFDGVAEEPELRASIDRALQRLANPSAAAPTASTASTAPSPAPSVP